MFLLFFRTLSSLLFKCELQGASHRGDESECQPLVSPLDHSIAIPPSQSHANFGFRILKSDSIPYPDVLPFKAGNQSDEGGDGLD